MRSCIAALALFTALPLGSDASAQDAEAPAERRTATEYVVKLRAGLTQLAEGDVTGAMTTFHEAIRSEPNQAEGHCHLGSAQRQNGDMADALSSFQQCARLASQAGDAMNEGRGLAGTAHVLVLDRERRDEARRAVAALTRFAQTNALVFPVADARALQRALDSIIELDAVSAEVRTRREARAAQNAE